MAKKMGKNYFIFLGSKITVDGGCSHEIKRCILLGRKAITNLDSVLKSKDISLLTKVCIVKVMGFPVVMYRQMWELDHKEGWVLKNWCFPVWYWRRLLRVPCTAMRSNQSILEKINPDYSLEGLMLKLKLQHIGHLMWRAASLEKTPKLGRIESKRSRGHRGWDG